MEHELLHNEPDYNLKLSNRPKKEKIDPGERKKWNFRKTSTSETGGKRTPSPTSGLINPSAEVKSKRTVSPTMIFENKISDNDYVDEHSELRLPSPPIPINSPTPLQQMHISPKAVSFDNQSNSKRLRQKSLSLSTSPPLIARPQSARKPAERIFRQASAPATAPPIQPSSKVNYQQSPIPVANESFSTPTTTSQADGCDVQRIMNTGDLHDNNQWKSIQQTLFSPPEKLPQEEISNRQRMTSEKDTPGGESVDESSNIMWQGNKKQELIHGNWTDFTSNSNEVFVPDDKAWGVSENAAVDADENGHESTGDATNSSSSSNSSDSDNEQNTEESVWKINEEQRAYYLNQFRILQPAEKGAVTGQRARDFFLKSGLPNDVLSKIWNLADLDNDGALNFEEFCIAMHVVVAVRHGLEVPTALPPYLIPEQHEKQVPVVSPSKVEASNMEELPLPDPPQTWARFSPDPGNPNKAILLEEDTTKAQPAVQPAVEPAVQPAVQPVVEPAVQPVVQPAAQPAVQPAAQPAAQTVYRTERSMSDPTSADENATKDNNSQPARKTSVGIPRMRGTFKKTNLLDTPHWAILPPPSKFKEDAGKSVPIGTIIPDDTNDDDDGPQQVENVERQSPRDSQSDSSSSEETTGQKERPKSLTTERNIDSSSGSLSKSSSHDSVGVNQEDSVDAARKSNAPVPPPRKKTGHSRSSSLDLQKLFNNKGSSNSFQPAVESGSSKSEKSHNEEVEQNTTTNGTEDKDATQQEHESQENFADFSKFDIASIPHLTENVSRHRRSASLDSIHAIWVEPSPPQQNQQDQVKNSHTRHHEVSASLPRPVPKKKPASPPPPLRQKDIQQDSGSDGIMEKERKTNKEPIHFVVKPLTRLEQLHARIRDLKTKNTILSRVNNELQQELKQMMEQRIQLESSVEQFKPLSNV